MFETKSAFFPSLDFNLRDSTYGFSNFKASVRRQSCVFSFKICNKTCQIENCHSSEVFSLRWLRLEWPRGSLRLRGRLLSHFPGFLEALAGKYPVSKKPLVLLFGSAN